MCIRDSYQALRAKDKSLPDGQAGFIAEYKTAFDESIGKINVVPQDMGRVLLNLINNAFYAVNEKRKTAGRDYKPIVTVETKRFSDTIEIRVSDNGTGIPENIVAVSYTHLTLPTSDLV